MKLFRPVALRALEQSEHRDHRHDADDEAAGTAPETGSGAAQQAAGDRTDSQQYEGDQTAYREHHASGVADGRSLPHETQHRATPPAASRHFGGGGYRLIVIVTTRSALVRVPIST